MSLGFLTTLAQAQIPDVQVKFDLGPTYHSEIEGSSALRWYDRFGRHSTVALQFALEPGFRAFVSQKIQRIPGDGDRDQIDESYVEDTGVWRAGKQYLPFGSLTIMRESVLAVRSDTELLFRYLPAQLAACDGGEERQRGLVGRVGTRLGVSFFVGRHFGISATSFNLIRGPEESSGRGAGYKRALGLDYSRKQGIATFRGEYVLLLEGEGEDDEERSVLDVNVTLEDSVYRSLTIGYTVSSNPGVASLRIQGKILAAPNVWVEPWVRTRDAKLFDAGATLRVRL